MTPILNLSGVRTACQRRNCSSGSDRLHRHHMGCERMFVKHFRARSGTVRYEAFKARYEAFDPRDLALLCDECHFEIHILYGPTIQRSLRKLRKPMSRWTWTEAELLMDELRELCLAWIKRPEDYTVQSANAVSTLSTFTLPTVPDRVASLRRISEAGAKDGAKGPARNPPPDERRPRRGG